MKRRKKWVEYPVLVIEHNMTEGAPPQYYWAADVLLLSETDHAKLRKHAPKHWAWYFPKNDPHQAIGWNTETMRHDNVMRNGRPRTWAQRSFRFHRSGKAEHWALRTPSRWIHEVDLVHKATGLPFTFGTMWWLNSWRKEKRRERIVRQLTVPVVRQRMNRCRARKRLGIYGGDTNHVSINFRGWFKGYRSKPKRGLDRLFWTRTPGLVLKKLTKGRKVGVGPQKKHESLVAEFRIRLPR